MNGLLKWKRYNFYRNHVQEWKSKLYSCFGEDTVIDLILNSKRKSFWGDIGAFHPGKYSNTKYFSKHLGWTGINIEPNIENFKLFKKRRPAEINVNVGFFYGRFRIKIVPIHISEIHDIHLHLQSSTRN